MVTIILTTSQFSLTPTMTNTTTDDEHFDSLPSWEQHLIAGILVLFFVMGMLGNSSILAVIRNFKPSVSFQRGPDSE